MDKIIMTRKDSTFTDLVRKLENLTGNYRLADLYEAFAPWKESCVKEYPELYTCFAKENSSYSSWEDAEYALPLVSLSALSDGRVEMTFDHRLFNFHFFRFLASFNGADLEIRTEKEIVLESCFSDESLKTAFRITGFEYTHPDAHTITIRHASGFEM